MASQQKSIKFIEDVELIPENYSRFVVKLRVAYRRYIPRGCRTNCIPGLSEESKSLHEDYKKQYTGGPFDNGNIETGNALMNNMKEEKKRWEEVLTSINMTHNSRKALSEISHTQHCPICVTVNPVLVSRPTAFRRRFNLRKANWSGYATDVDILIDEVDPTLENYERFVEAIRVTSRKHIPRGCRSHYIPGLSEESKSLYEAYKKQYMSNPFDSTTLDTGNELISKMAAENKRKWEEMITSTDMTGNSQKTW